MHISGCGIPRGDGDVASDGPRAHEEGPVRICAGGLLTRGHRILLGRRSDDRAFYPGVWDVIGGHCETGETPANALIRELREEIGVEARAVEEIAVLDEPHPEAHGEARYHIFLVTAWDGEPQLRNREHSELRWFEIDRASDVPLAHPDYRALFRVVTRGRGWSARPCRR